jgi:hypothetical protein
MAASGERRRQTTPLTAISRSNPRLTICGIIAPPMAETSAIADPDTPPKNKKDRTLVWPNPPRRCPTREDASAMIIQDVARIHLPRLHQRHADEGDAGDNENAARTSSCSRLESFSKRLVDMRSASGEYECSDCAQKPATSKCRLV